VAFSPDGKTLAVGAEKLFLWDVASRKKSSVLAGHNLRTHALAFSPEGNTPASAGSDKTIRLWNVHTAKAVAALKGHTAYLSDLTVKKPKE
jgi:WD40 repeat protein